MHESERLAWYRDQLVKAAQLLAVGPDDDADALPDFVHVPDELRLVWDDAFILAGQVRYVGLITADTFRLAASLDEAINAAPVIQDYDAALRAIADSPQWMVIRERAQTLVGALGADLESPDLRAGYFQ